MVCCNLRVKPGSRSSGEKCRAENAIGCRPVIFTPSPYTIEYLIRNNATIIVTGSIDLTGTRLPELPRFGMRMELQQPYENLTYYGRGPFENYIDRYSSSFIGRYEDKVDNQFYWYIRPQETGNKTDVRWLALLNSEGEGVKITGLQPIAFSALHFSPEDLDPGLTRKLQHTIDIITA